MLQITRLMIIAMLLAVTGLAHAALDTYEETYELGLDEVQLPAHTSGNVVVRACPDCPPVLRRVNSSTVYRLGSAGPQVTLSELREAAEAASDGAVYVAYATDSGNVNRIILSVSD